MLVEQQASGPREEGFSWPTQVIPFGSASIRVTNGVEVRLTATEVQLSKLGPRGGEGVSIVIPIAEWNKVNDGVQALKNAIQAVDAAVKAATEAPSAGAIRP